MATARAVPRLKVRLPRRRQDEVSFREDLHLSAAFVPRQVFRVGQILPIVALRAVMMPTSLRDHLQTPKVAGMHQKIGRQNHRGIPASTTEAEILTLIEVDHTLHEAMREMIARRKYGANMVVGQKGSKAQGTLLIEVVQGLKVATLAVMADTTQGMTVLGGYQTLAMSVMGSLILDPVNGLRLPRLLRLLSSPQ